MKSARLIEKDMKRINLLNSVTKLGEEAVEISHAVFKILKHNDQKAWDYLDAELIDFYNAFLELYEARFGDK